jgi:hypothetical protein
VGYGVLSRKSDAKATDPLQVLYVADDQTSRISIQLNYDFNLGARHNLTLGTNLADKKDNTFNKRDQKNNTYFGSLTTMFNFPLQTTVSFNSNMTESSQLSTVPLSNALLVTEFKLTAISFNAQYRLLEDKLRLSGAFSSSTGDLKRTLIQAGADYSITSSHALAFQYDLIQNTGFDNDNIMSLVYRFNF